MAEYIEREALMRKIKEVHCAECDSYHGVRCRSCWVGDTLDYIDSEPAADVAPVVRCKDCRKFKTYSCRMVASGYDDFCSYGERKDGADAEG